MDKKELDFIYEQVHRRLGPIAIVFDSFHGFFSCGFSSFGNPAFLFRRLTDTIHFFKNQFITLERCYLYNEIYLLAFIPLIISIFTALMIHGTKKMIKVIQSNY